jgi:hypothetical protein
MDELVRDTAVGTIQLLSGLIANPEAVAKFAQFFDHIQERRCIMSVSSGEYQQDDQAPIRRGTVVTVSIYAGEGQFEIQQAFLPVAASKYTHQSTWFTDCIHVSEYAIIKLDDAELIGQ